jgi:hypothetical protein
VRRPPPSSGLKLASLLVGALLATVLIGQIPSPDSSPKPPTSVAPAAAPPRASVPDLVGAPDLASGPDLVTAPDLVAALAPDRPAGYEPLRRCREPVGGLLLDDHRSSGWALERWDCEAPKGPWSVVIRGAGGRFGLHSAVLTFPVGRALSGALMTKPQGGLWNPDLRRLVWPIAGSHAQIVGDLSQTELADLAMSMSIGGGRPQLTGVDGFAATATIPYRPSVVHEMRYSTADLGQLGTLGDGLVYTGTLSGASFESQVFEVQPQPAGMVRGKPAVYAQVKGRNGTLAWEPVPGEVAYIGFSGSPARTDPIEALRGLADKGRALTPAQWQTKDRISPGAPLG